MPGSKTKNRELREIGDRVRQLRRGHGWTQDKLAAETGISKSFISEIETGESNPRGVKLVRLANALGASLDFLMTGQEPQPAPPTQLEIPAELSELAEAKRWPFSHVKALVEFSNLIEARHRDSGTRRLSKADWARYYESVSPHLANRPPEDDE